MARLRFIYLLGALLLVSFAFPTQPVEAALDESVESIFSADVKPEQMASCSTGTYDVFFHFVDWVGDVYPQPLEGVSVSWLLPDGSVIEQVSKSNGFTDNICLPAGAVTGLSVVIPDGYRVSMVPSYSNNMQNWQIHRGQRTLTATITQHSYYSQILDVAFTHEGADTVPYTSFCGYYSYWRLAGVHGNYYNHLEDPCPLYSWKVELGPDPNNPSNVRFFDGWNDVLNATKKGDIRIYPVPPAP